MKGIIYVLMLLVIMVGVMAQAEDKVVSQVAGVTPDSPFYALDNFFDDLKIRLAQGEKAKIEARLEIAEEKLAEYKVMDGRGKKDKAGIALNNHNLRLAEIDEEKLDDKEKADLQMRLYKHLVVLEGIHSKLPENEGLDNALVSSRKSFDRLRDDLPEDLQKSDVELHTLAELEAEKEFTGAITGDIDKVEIGEKALKNTQAKDRLFAIYGVD